MTTTPPPDLAGLGPVALAQIRYRRQHAESVAQIMPGGRIASDAWQASADDVPDLIAEVVRLQKQEQRLRCPDLTQSPRGWFRCVLPAGHDRDPLSLHTIDVNGPVERQQEGLAAAVGDEPGPEEATAHAKAVRARLAATVAGVSPCVGGSCEEEGSCRVHRGLGVAALSDEGDPAGHARGRGEPVVGDDVDYLPRSGAADAPETCPGNIGTGTPHLPSCSEYDAPEDATGKPSCGHSLASAAQDATMGLPADQGRTS